MMTACVMGYWSANGMRVGLTVAALVAATVGASTWSRSGPSFATARDAR